MPVYMIIDARIKDVETYGRYIEAVLPIVEKYGGRYLVRGREIRSLGAWKPERLIVIEFPAEENIRQWLASPEYRDIAPLREAGADAQAVIVKGEQKRIE